MRAIVLTLLVLVYWIQPNRDDERPTFCGKTVEGWREVLRDNAGTADGRRQAVWALGGIGPLAKPAVPDLIEAVRHGEFKGEAVEALVLIGSGAEVTVPILIERFLKRGCQHRTGMGTFFVDDSMEESLVRIGGPAVPALLEVLKGPDKDMRVCVAAVLGKIGPAARAAVPALIRTIEHPDTDRQAVVLRSFAIRALGRIGPEARAAIPVLNRHLDEALKRLPSEGDHIAFDVAKAAEDRMSRDRLHREVRLVALDVATALDRIDAPPVRKLLDSFLHTGDWFMASQLAWFGARAREATPRLRGALSNKRLEVRIFSAVALAHIEPSATESIPVLIEGLNHYDDEGLNVRQIQQVLRALARLGPRARPALPTLIGVLKKDCDDPYVLMALVQIDPEGRECVPALIGALDHDDYHVVDVAANCLGLLGPHAKDAVSPLAAVVTRDFENEEFYDGVDPPVSAARALRRIGPAATPAIPALIAALKYRRIVRPRDLEEYRDPSAAAAAAAVLGAFGADAKAAIPHWLKPFRPPRRMTRTGASARRRSWPSAIWGPTRSRRSPSSRT
jgi:HEAT repeat protein